MINNLLAGFVVAVCFASSFAQSQSPEISLTGRIIAVQRHSRCANCVTPTGIGVFSEFWIVEAEFEQKRSPSRQFILVEYRIYERGLSDKELNQTMLFHLKKQKKTEDCLEVVVDELSNSRIPKLGDYEIFTPRKRIPDLRRLPCFVTTRIPGLVGSQ